MGGQLWHTAAQYSPFVALLVINLIAAGYDVFTSYGLRDSTVHPTVFAFLRASLSTVLLVGVAWFKERRRPAGDRVYLPEAADVGWLVATGTVALCGHMGLSAVALGLAPPALVGMFAPMAPAMALAISLLIGTEAFHRREMSSWLKIAGASVTLAGGIAIAIIAVSGESDLKTESKNLSLGIAFLFAAKLCSATYPILMKRMLYKYRSHVVTALMYVFGSISLLTSVIPLLTNPAYWTFNLASGVALLYGVLLASAVNYSLISWVNKRLNPVLLTASYPLESIFAPVFAFAALGQRITAADGVGGAIIIVGLLITVYAKWREGNGTPVPTVADLLAAKADSSVDTSSDSGRASLTSSPAAHGMDGMGATSFAATAATSSDSVTMSLLPTPSVTMDAAMRAARRRTTASRIFLDPTTADDANVAVFEVPIGITAKRNTSAPTMLAMGPLSSGSGGGGGGGGLVGMGMSEGAMSPHPLLRHAPARGSAGRYQRLESVDEGEGGVPSRAGLDDGGGGAGDYGTSPHHPAALPRLSSSFSSPEAQHGFAALQRARQLSASESVASAGGWLADGSGHEDGPG